LQEFRVKTRTLISQNFSSLTISDKYDREFSSAKTGLFMEKQEKDE
jgi:hypothetical protein